MPMFKAATPGTLLVLAGTVLMILVTLSVPIIQGIYFLSANFNGSGGGTSLSGRVTLGTLGYCGASECISPTLGYELNADQLLGIASDYINLPNNLIKWLTYVLVLHPIGAGLGLLALICGLLGHIREFSIVLSLTATWLAGLAGTITMIAFIFDMVVFTLVKSRINSAAQSSGGVTVNTGASYGTAIWLTLAAFILFTMAGCCFKFGRRVARERRATSEGVGKPSIDPYFQRQAREDAEKAEQERLAERGVNSRAERGLPSFAENISDPAREEQIPLRSYEGENGSTYNDPYADQINGVGMGYGRRRENPAAPSRRSTGYSSEEHHSNGYDRERLPSHAEAFTSMDPHNRGNGSVITSSEVPGAYGLANTPAPYQSSYGQQGGYGQQGNYQSNTPYQPSTAPYQSSAAPYQSSATPYQQQPSMPYQPTSTPSPYVPAPAPAAYAAYNSGYDSPVRSRTPYDRQQQQSSYEQPTARAMPIPQSDPTYDYDQPSAYTNPQNNSHQSSSYQTAQQGSLPYETNDAYGGTTQDDSYDNPYYRSEIQPNATGVSYATSNATALPQYRSEAGSHACDHGVEPLAQSWNGYSTDSAGANVGRQRTTSPRGPRQMSRSYGASEGESQQQQTGANQQYGSRY